MRRSLRLALQVVLGAAAPAAAQFPIFDAHIHYSRPDWEVYTRRAPGHRLEHAGRRHAKLYEKAPKGVVPFLRPYRARDDMGSWPSDPGVQAYVEERLKRGIYRGIGEFHLGVADVGAPTIGRIAELEWRGGFVKKPPRLLGPPTPSGRRRGRAMSGSPPAGRPGAPRPRPPARRR